MNVITTRFADLLVIEPQVWGDDRGYFFESYRSDLLEQYGADYDWVQDNEAFSGRGVLRGLHYQRPPMAQSKLVRVVQGEVLDVVVDIRPDSVTYGEHFSLIISGSNKKQLLVPAGFAHGYIVLSDTAIFAYKVDQRYDRDSESGIAYDDPALGIDWILPADTVLLSDKDKVQPRFGNHDPYTTPDQ